MRQDIPFLPGLSPVYGLDLHARFDGETLSSDGGVLLLREIERQLEVADVMATCFCDQRDPVRMRHSYVSMIRSAISSRPMIAKVIIVTFRQSSALLARI